MGIKKNRQSKGRENCVQINSGVQEEEEEEEEEKKNKNKKKEEEEE